MADSYHSRTPLSLTSYRSSPSTHTPLDPFQQNQILTQSWLWLPHMRCSLHNDIYPGNIYMIVEATWNGYSKIYHLQQIFGSRGEGMRDALEGELKAVVEDDGRGSGFGDLVLRGAGEGRIGGALRRKEVGLAGRALGIDLIVESSRYLGGSTGMEGMYHPGGGHQYGSSGYRSGYGSSYGHGQGKAFDSSSEEEERRHGRGGDRRDWRNERDDRDDRDGSNSRRGSHGKDSNGKKTQGRDKERDKRDKKGDKREKSSPERKERN